MKKSRATIQCERKSIMDRAVAVDDQRNIYNAGKAAGTGCSLALCLLLFLSLLDPDSARADVFDTSRDSSSLLAGYGQSIPGWGTTTQRVETIDLVYRYNHLIFAAMGSGWYKGYPSTFLEVPVHAVVRPDSSVMVGLNFLAAYTFTSDQKWQPYLFGGGGPVYSFADIPGMGAELNGNYQFGFGLDHTLTGGRHVLVEVRYHHISNASTEDPNIPLNSFKILVGFSL